VPLCDRNREESVKKNADKAHTAKPTQKSVVELDAAHYDAINVSYLVGVASYHKRKIVAKQERLTMLSESDVTSASLSNSMVVHRAAYQHRQFITMQRITSEPDGS